MWNFPGGLDPHHTLIDKFRYLCWGSEIAIQPFLDSSLTVPGEKTLFHRGSGNLTDSPTK